jgi:hypothetical protein
MYVHTGAVLGVVPSSYFSDKFVNQKKTVKVKLSSVPTYMYNWKRRRPSQRLLGWKITRCRNSYISTMCIFYYEESSSTLILFEIDSIAYLNTRFLL